jgi:hypothetical protein
VITRWSSRKIGLRRGMQIERYADPATTTGCLGRAIGQMIQDAIDRYWRRAGQALRSLRQGPRRSDFRPFLSRDRWWNSPRLGTLTYNYNFTWRAAPQLVAPVGQPGACIDCASTIFLRTALGAEGKRNARCDDPRVAPHGNLKREGNSVLSEIALFGSKLRCVAEP